MPDLFALGDLHLSTSGDKPMDVFGEVWARHDERMAAAWDASVGPEDVVLLAGDLSWARKLEQAAGDLAWIASRPGRKLLLRGNHDGWWGSVAQVRSKLPAGCSALQNDAHDVGPWIVVGARGWTEPGDPIATAEDAAIFRRELERLRLSIADADRRFGREKPRVAMLHYPPWIEGRAPSEVVTLLRDGAVRDCVYGHLHGKDHALGVVGERDGIRYHLVAADAVGFAPVRIAASP
jgi:predicted phosphohydrolase